MDSNYLFHCLHVLFSAKSCMFTWNVQYYQFVLTNDIILIPMEHWMLWWLYCMAYQEYYEWSTGTKRMSLHLDISVNVWHQFSNGSFCSTFLTSSALCYCLCLQSFSYYFHSWMSDLIEMYHLWWRVESIIEYDILQPVKIVRLVSKDLWVWKDLWYNLCDEACEKHSNVRCIELALRLPLSLVSCDCVRFSQLWACVFDIVCTSSQCLWFIDMYGSFNKTNPYIDLLSSYMWNLCTHESVKLVVIVTN